MPEKWLDGGLSTLNSEAIERGFEYSEPLFGQDEKIDEKLSPENVRC